MQKHQLQGKGLELNRTNQEKTEAFQQKKGLIFVEALPVANKELRSTVK